MFRFSARPSDAMISLFRSSRLMSRVDSRFISFDILPIFFFLITIAAMLRYYTFVKITRGELSISLVLKMLEKMFQYNVALFLRVETTGEPFVMAQF